MIINNKKYQIHPSMFRTVQKDFLNHQQAVQGYNLDPMYIYKEDASITLMIFLTENNLKHLTLPKEVFIEQLLDSTFNEANSLMKLIANKEISITQMKGLMTNSKIVDVMKSPKQATFTAKNIEDFIISFGHHANDNSIEGQVLYNLRTTMQVMNQFILDLSKIHESAMIKIEFIMDCIKSKKQIAESQLEHLDGYSQIGTQIKYEGFSLKVSDESINNLKLKLLQAQKNKVKTTKLKDLQDYKITLPELLKVARESLNE